MSNELNTELFISGILNTMSGELTDVQMVKLKQVLYLNLHDVELRRQCYDLATTVESNDAKKLEYFAVSKRLTGRSEKTIKQYVRSAWALREYLGKNFTDITSIDIKFYLAHCQSENHWKDSTVESQCNYLRTFFDFLVGEDLIAKNPMDKIEKIKREKTLKKPFTSKEMERIRNACYDDARNIALIEFLYSTGLRISNVVDLTWKDLDMSSRKLQVRLKGGKEKVIFFSEKAGYYLERLMDQRMAQEKGSKDELMALPVFVGRKRGKKTHKYDALTADGVREILKSIGEKAGVKEIHPHKFRRTFACSAINHGMPLEELKEHMGHADFNTTLIYARLNNVKLEQSYRTYCE